jgi:hypothetical protein
MTADTLITTPFGHGTTAAEVIEGIDLSGRAAVVTGGASGIGMRLWELSEELLGL